MKAFTLRVQADNRATMNLTLADPGNGIRLHQDFDGIWTAEGLRKLAAALRGAAEMLEA